VAGHAQDMPLRGIFRCHSNLALQVFHFDRLNASHGFSSPNGLESWGVIYLFL